MKKGIKIIVCLAIVAGLAGGGWYLYRQYQQREAERIAREEYLATHVTIDGTDYETSLTELDLSGKTLTQWRGLERIQGLQKLDLRGTGIDANTYDSIRAMLPGCEITWSVPFQGGYLSQNTSVITVSTLTEEDVQALSYLPRLTQINAEECRDYEVLRQVNALYPNVTVSYTVDIGGNTYPGNVRELELTDPDLAQLEAAIPYLPQLEYVHLMGNLPEPADIAQLQERIPHVALDFTFAAFGRVFNSLDTFIDLSGISMKDTQEVEKIIPYFRDLQQIDMLDCGLNNRTMDALNKRYRDTKIVWRVYISGAPYRTDAKYYFPGKYKIKNVSDDLRALRYCTDMELVDLGHYGVSDLSFVEYMPNLKYLLVCQISYLADLTPISQCKNLVSLEIFGDNVSDIWPFTNLTNLEEINVSQSPVTFRVGMIRADYAEFDDLSAFREMTWLDRLWLVRCILGPDGRNFLLERHQNTEIAFQAYSATGAGWRHTRNYYDMRDLCDMTYFVH